MLQKEHFFSFSCFCLFLFSLNSWRLVWFHCHPQSTVFYPSLIFPPALGRRKGLWLKDAVQTTAICISNMHGRFGWWWCAGGLLLALAGNHTSSHPATSQFFDSSVRVGNYFSLEAALTPDQNRQPVVTSCFAASTSTCLLFSAHLSSWVGSFFFGHDIRAVQNLLGVWGTTTHWLVISIELNFVHFFTFLFLQQPLIFQVAVWAPPAVLFWLWPTSAHIWLAARQEGSTQLVQPGLNAYPQAAGHIYCVGAAF